MRTEMLPSDPFHVGFQTIRSNNWDRTGSCFLVSTLSWLVDWLAIGGPNGIIRDCNRESGWVLELIDGTGWKTTWWMAIPSHNWACLSDLKIRRSRGDSLRLKEDYTNEENQCFVFLWARSSHYIFAAAYWMLRGSEKIYFSMTPSTIVQRSKYGLIIAWSNVLALMILVGHLWNMAGQCSLYCVL